MKISEIRLLVDKYDACFDFYANKLGLAVTWGKPGEVYASFALGEEVMLSIFAAHLMDEHVGMTGVNRQRTSDQTVLALAVDNVDAVYAELQGRHVATLNSPHDMPGWGMRCFHLRDPEGNLVEIMSVLPKEQWSEDLQANDPGTK